MALKGAEGGGGEGEGRRGAPRVGPLWEQQHIRPILEMNMKYLHSPSVKLRVSVFESSIASAVSSSGTHSSSLFFTLLPLPCGAQSRALFSLRIMASLRLGRPGII